MQQGSAVLSALVNVTYGKRPILRDCALDIRRGEILGLAGSSGSGKSTLALALLNLLDSRQSKLSGHVQFNGRDLLTLKERELRSIRGREIALILQSPAAALNPTSGAG